MTDNLVSYYVINGGCSRVPTLHELVMEIKALEIELGFHLEVVHVPGTLMIEQGTDGLSRGLWLAAERRPADVNQQLFNAIKITDPLMEWALEVSGNAGRRCKIMDFSLCVDMREADHQLSLWAPPPECGRQVLVAFLQRWVQVADDTSGLFLIPRILQRSWGRVCRYVQEIGVYLPTGLPGPCRWNGVLPFVLLYIPAHVLSLRNKPRMDKSAPPRAKRWHQFQAQEVRGLS